MRGFSLALFLAVMCGCLFVPALHGQAGKGKEKEPDKKDVKNDLDKEQIRDDETLLRSKKVDLDGASLLKYFKDRTFGKADPERVNRLIKDLSSEDFRAREKAFQTLRILSSAALFGLKTNKNHPDTETRIRIDQLLKTIESNADSQVQGAVARLLGVRKPKETCKVILAFVPFAADSSVVEELQNTLIKVAVENGKANPTLLKTLTSEFALLRAMAGVALVDGGAKEHLTAVRKLLKDKAAIVRVPIAESFVMRQDVKAVPVLIDALKELPPEKLWEAENILLRLAGEKAPQVSLGTTADERKKTYLAWNKWWQQQPTALMKKRLAKLKEMDKYHGYIQVLSYFSSKRIKGMFRSGQELVEVGVDKNFKKPRWSFELYNSNTGRSSSPIDFLVTGPNRLAMLESAARRITLRDFNGRILKTIRFTSPTDRYAYPRSIEKLHNGNYFVLLSNNRMIEFDKRWKQVWSYQGNRGTVYRANKSRDGTVVFATSSQLYMVNSKTNAIVRTINTGYMGGNYGGLQVLRNGNVLVPRYSNSQVVEYDRKGKVVWQSNAVPNPTCAIRLPNGDTLVASQRSYMLALLNRQGRQLWAQRMTGTIYRVRVR